MPRHPKPVALRQNRERRDIGLLEPPRARSTVPDPPRGLLKGNRASWERFWRSPLAQVIQADTDLPALTRLWSLYDERERCYRGLRGQRVVLGSKRQLRPNPLFGPLAVMDAEIRQLEDRFGLSPRARLTLGVIFGDAARSLADLNADLEADPDAGPDPRLLTLDR